MNNLRDSACVVADSSNIFAISGFDGTSYLSTMDVYDPAKDIWTCEGNPNCKILYRHRLLDIH